ATTEDMAKSFDLRRGPMGEIRQGTVTDLAVLTVALAQKDGRRGATVRDGNHVHDCMVGSSILLVKAYVVTYMTTQRHAKLAYPMRTQLFMDYRPGELPVRRRSERRTLPPMQTTPGSESPIG